MIPTFPLAKETRQRPKCIFTSSGCMASTRAGDIEYSNTFCTNKLFYKIGTAGNGYFASIDQPVRLRVFDAVRQR